MCSQWANGFSLILQENLEPKLHLNLVPPWVKGLTFCSPCRIVISFWLPLFLMLPWSGGALPPRQVAFYLAKCNPHSSLGTSMMTEWRESGQDIKSIPYCYHNPNLLRAWGCPHKGQGTGQLHFTTEKWRLGTRNILWTSVIWVKLQKPPRLIFRSLSSEYSDLILIKRWSFTYYYGNRHTWT